MASMMKYLKIDYKKKLVLYNSFSGLPGKNPMDYFEQGSFYSERNVGQIKNTLNKFNQIEVF
jgi:hypothetical protein